MHMHTHTVHIVRGVCIVDLQWTAYGNIQYLVYNGCIVVTDHSI